MTNRLPVLLALLLPAAPAASSQVEVSFGDLSKFRDLRISVLTTERDREGLAAVLEERGVQHRKRVGTLRADGAALGRDRVPGVAGRRDL